MLDYKFLWEDIRNHYKDDVVFFAISEKIDCMHPRAKLFSNLKKTLFKKGIRKVYVMGNPSIVETPYDEDDPKFELEYLPMSLFWDDRDKIERCLSESRRIIFMFEEVNVPVYVGKIFKPERHMIELGRMAEMLMVWNIVFNYL